MQNSHKYNAIQSAIQCNTVTNTTHDTILHLREFSVEIKSNQFQSGTEAPSMLHMITCSAWLCDGAWQVSNNIVIVYHYIITVKTVILIIWSFIKCLTYRWSVVHFLHRSLDQKLEGNTRCSLTDDPIYHYISRQSLYGSLYGYFG